MRREIPLIITTVAGLVFAVSYFIPHWPFGEAESIFGDWISIVQAFAIWLGVLSLVKVSLEKVSRQPHERPYALVTIITLVGTIVAGLWAGIAGLGQTPMVSFRDTAAFSWIYEYLYTSLTSTMFSILAFFVASAAYRAFRARNFEATLLLIAGFFVMGGRVPLFDLALGSVTGVDTSIFSDFADWIMNYPNSAGQRAIMIGIALGIMSSSLRVILGIERSHIGGES